MLASIYNIKLAYSNVYHQLFTIFHFVILSDKCEMKSIICEKGKINKGNILYLFCQILNLMSFWLLFHVIWFFCLQQTLKNSHFSSIICFHTFCNKKLNKKLRHCKTMNNIFAILITFTITFQTANLNKILHMSSIGLRLLILFFNCYITKYSFYNSFHT